MVKAKNLTLGLLCTLALTSCGNAATQPSTISKDVEKIDNLIENLQKGYTVSGTIIQTNRYYTNDNYNVINSNLKSNQTKYAFEYTYQNSKDYTGVDRNLYLIDGETPRLIIDDNCFEKDNAVYINSLFYDNIVESHPASNQNDEDDLNEVAYGSSGLINPFLNISSDDFEIANESTYSIDNNKVSAMILDMFVSIDESAFAMGVKRNSLTLDAENNGIDKMFVTLDEYKTTLTDGDKYQNIYCGQTFDIAFNFTDEGVADAKNKVKPYAKKAENEPLRKIFDKMEGQNLKTTRRDVTFYDGEEVKDGYETIVNYYDGTKMFYQVYDAARESAPTSVRNSDFLMLPVGEKNLLYPHIRTKEGEWKDARQTFGRIGGYPYKSYLPIIGGISSDIFTYDKATKTYHVPEYLAVYFTFDGCLVPTVAVSSAIYYGFVNDVEIKLKDNGDIDYARIWCYFNSGAFVQTGYYEMTYEYGPNITMPFGIDEELKAQQGKEQGK